MAFRVVVCALVSAGLYLLKYFKVIGQVMAFLAEPVSAATKIFGTFKTIIDGLNTLRDARNWVRAAKAWLSGVKAWWVTFWSTLDELSKAKHQESLAPLPVEPVPVAGQVQAVEPVQVAAFEVETDFKPDPPPTTPPGARALPPKVHHFVDAVGFERSFVSHQGDKSLWLLLARMLGRLVRRRRTLNATLDANGYAMFATGLVGRIGDAGSDNRATAADATTLAAGLTRLADFALVSLAFTGRGRRADKVTIHVDRRRDLGFAMAGLNYAERLPADGVFSKTDLGASTMHLDGRVLYGAKHDAGISDADDLRGLNSILAELKDADGADTGAGVDTTAMSNDFVWSVATSVSGADGALADTLVDGTKGAVVHLLGRFSSDAVNIHKVIGNLLTTLGANRRQGRLSTALNGTMTFVPA